MDEKANKTAQPKLVPHKPNIPDRVSVELEQFYVLKCYQLIKVIWHKTADWLIEFSAINAAVSHPAKRAVDIEFPPTNYESSLVKNLHIKRLLKRNKKRANEPEQLIKLMTNWITIAFLNNINESFRTSGEKKNWHQLGLKNKSKSRP